MNILNTAIIGAGAIHSCHVNALRQIPNVALRALVDIDSVKGLKLAMNYQCRFYQDYREMLLDDSIDVVHICTPHFEHKNMILAALAAGKHVFCEKPVGMNSSELADIASAAAQAPGRLGVCYQNRLNPTSLRIRKELAEGVLGKMLSIKAVLTWSRSGAYYTESPWRGQLATEGGSLLINRAIHTLDLMQWFAGGVTRLKGVVDSGELADVTQGKTARWPRFSLPTVRAVCFMPATATPRIPPLSGDPLRARLTAAQRQHALAHNARRTISHGKRCLSRWHRKKLLGIRTPAGDPPFLSRYSPPGEYGFYRYLYRRKITQDCGGFLSVISVKTMDRY